MKYRKRGVQHNPRRTKIVATLGPATEDPEILRALLLSGVNVVRFNFSHGTHKSHSLLLRKVKKLRDELHLPVALLADLSGPKFRVGAFENGSVILEDGKSVLLVGEDTVEKGTSEIIPVQHPEILSNLRPGHILLLDDGRVKLEVTENSAPGRVCARVLHGGILANHKGLNIPHADLPIPSLTSKDKDDLAFSLREGIDYVALSFVRSANDVKELRKFIQSFYENHFPENARDIQKPGIIAKIEKPEAFSDIENIVEYSDGIMVARGDLGVEMELEKVPILQNTLIQKAHQCNKPVIIATQMLESMIHEPVPTRAEVNDVAHAVLHHADALMLSAETAVGKYPLEAVIMMDRIIREIESYQEKEGFFGRLESDVSIYPMPNAISRACTLLSQDLAIKCIHVLTRTGRTARILSTSRPEAPILAHASHHSVVCQMNLLWGVQPFHIQEDITLHEFVDVANVTAKEMGYARKGEYVLLVSSPLKKITGRATGSIIVLEIT